MNTDRVSDYYAWAGDTPTPAIKVLIERVSGRDAALDLGAGTLRDSRFLLSKGFRRVVAVDEVGVDGPYPLGIEFHRMKVEDYIFQPNSFDIVIAVNFLYFLEKDAALAVIDNAYRALRSGGMLFFNVLGDKHGWVTRRKENQEEAPTLSWFTLSEIRRLKEKFPFVFAMAFKEWKEISNGPRTLWHQWLWYIVKP